MQRHSTPVLAVMIEKIAFQCCLRVKLSLQGSNAMLNLDRGAVTKMNKILVINDSRFERLILKDMLNRLGYSVKDTDEFISMRQIDLYDPDIIIVNRTMYDISGLDLIDMIKTKNPKYKCFLSSCSPLKRSSIDASRADGAFQTPIGINELHDIIEGRANLAGELAGETEDDSVPESNLPAGEAEGNADVPVPAGIGGFARRTPAEKGAAPSPAVNFCSNCGGDIRHQPPYTYCPFCGHRV